MKAIKITIIMEQPNFAPHSEEIARDILREHFGVYPSFKPENVTFEEIEVTPDKVVNDFMLKHYTRESLRQKQKLTNEEYLDLHGSKDNAYLKARISSQEYFKLPEDKRRFYMRFCGHNEVYYTLNPEIK